MKTKKLFIIAMACIISVCCNSVNLVYADEGENDFNPNTMVTFGMVGQDGEMGLSPSIPFESSYFYGISHALYNYFYSEWHENANFPDFETWSDRLYSSQFASGFFDALAVNGWLMNVFINQYNQVYITYTRTPRSQDLVDIVTETRVEGGVSINFEPSDVFSGVAFAYGEKDSNGQYFLGLYAPYFSLNFSDNQLNSNVQFANNKLYSTGSWNSNSIGILSDLNIRFIVQQFDVSLPAMTISEQYYYDNIVYGTHFNTSTPCLLSGGISSSRYYKFKDVLVSMAPIYYSSYMDSYSFYSGTSYYSDLNKLTIKPSKIYGFEYNQELATLPIISTYENISQPATPSPTPTFTPTPSPMPTASITLVPSATPMPPVTPLEGLGQMFTLFTRKYTFTLNGAEIGIRPLYLFLACFFVGMIFRVFQGGNSE